MNTLKKKNKSINRKQIPASEAVTVLHFTHTNLLCEVSEVTLQRTLPVETKRSVTELQPDEKVNT